MSPPLAELTAHAQALTSSGDLAGARAVLADALAPTDTDPHRASPDVAAAAALHARVLVTLGDPQAARDWAGFAHTAQRRLYGPDDERTLAATATHAAVLHRLGNHALAAQLYRDVVEQLTATDGPDSMRVLAAQADLATAEHAAGECVDAHARMADAWQRHRRIYGDAAPAGIKMLARLGGMERDCGQVIEAREHLALAGEFCGRYLPGDHVLARQVAALAKAPISGRHRCDAEDTAHGFPPDSTRPTGHPAPGVTPTGAPGVTTLARPQQRPDAAGSPRSGSAGPGEHHGGDDRRLPVPVHHARPRTSRRLVVGAVVAAGALVAAATAALALPRDDRDPAAPVGAASAPATAAAPTATGATAPTPSTAAAAATGTAATGTVAAAPAPAPGTATTPAAATSAAAAPSAVVLRDARDSVTLEWAYPAGAEGPVLISGGRTGQQRRAFQQMPAGSTNYVVYGLNERADYCFTVAVVYSADVVAAAPPVCTARG